MKAAEFIAMLRERRAELLRKAHKADTPVLRAHFLAEAEKLTAAIQAQEEKGGDT